MPIPPQSSLLSVHRALHLLLPTSGHSDEASTAHAHPLRHGMTASAPLVPEQPETPETTDDSSLSSSYILPGADRPFYRSDAGVVRQARRVGDA